MQLTPVVHGDVTSITLPGHTLDATNTHEFKQAITPLLTHTGKLVLNLELVRFVDSSGCGSLLWCLRSMQENGGQLKLGGVSAQVEELFRIIRLDRQIEIFQTLQDALTAFGR